MKDRNIMDKYIWNQSDYAAFLGVRPATICEALKNHPERLCPPVPHPIGKSRLWNKDDVIRWYSAVDSIQQNASDCFFHEEITSKKEIRCLKSSD